MCGLAGRSVELSPLLRPSAVAPPPPPPQTLEPLCYPQTFPEWLCGSCRLLMGVEDAEPLFPSIANRPSSLQTDVLKCVVSSEPGFRSHWLVAALCSLGRFLKAAFFVLLSDR